MKKKFIVIGAVLLAVCMLIAVIICLIIRGKQNKQPNTFINDVGKDEIVDDGRGMAYVDAQLLLTAAEDIPYKEIERLVGSYGGKIVWFIELSNDYQLLFEGFSGREELNELANKLNNEPIVELCGLHHVITVSPETVIRPDDP